MPVDNSLGPFSFVGDVEPDHLVICFRSHYERSSLEVEEVAMLESVLHEGDEDERDDAEPCDW